MNASNGGSPHDAMARVDRALVHQVVYVHQTQVQVGVSCSPARNGLIVGLDHEPDFEDLEKQMGRELLVAEESKSSNVAKLKLRGGQPTLRHRGARRFPHPFPTF